MSSYLTTSVFNKHKVNSKDCFAFLNRQCLCSSCLNVLINTCPLKCLFLYYISCSVLKRSKPEFHLYSDLSTVQNVMCRGFSQVSFFSFSLRFRDLDRCEQYIFLQSSLIVGRQKTNLAFTIIFPLHSVRFYNFVHFCGLTKVIVLSYLSSLILRTFFSPQK